jgi:hypothetical protein
MGLHHHRQEDEDFPPDNESGKKEPPRSDEAPLWRDRVSAEDIRQAIHVKFKNPPDCKHGSWYQDIEDYRGFIVLFQHLLGYHFPLFPITTVTLSSDGRFLGKMQPQGRDIAEPEGLEVWVGLCEVDYAIAKICEIAEANGLTASERAFLLNSLPRFHLPD